MPSVAKTLCDQCGRRMGRASLVLDGKNLCLSCTGKVPLLPCTECGGNTRKRNPDGQPLCRSCRTKGRACAKCGVPLPRASLMTSDGAVCRYCYLDYKEPQACEQCGQLDLFLNSIETSEGSRRVCSGCWRKSRGYVCCGVCRKNRPQAGQLEDGRPLCKDCFQSGGKPFVCPMWAGRVSFQQYPLHHLLRPRAPGEEGWIERHSAAAGMGQRGLAGVR